MIDALFDDDFIDLPVAVLVAHPDDETVGLGNLLARLRACKLIHLTDGAPRDSSVAQRAGHATRERYAAARAGELDRALEALHAQPRERITYGCVDQEGAEHLREVAVRAGNDLAGARVVLTHAYEHGHPDHDACAFAVHAACALLRRADERAPAIVEFPSYHLRDGRGVVGEFWADAAHAERKIVLDPAQRERKARAIACFRSQRETLAAFPIGCERFRAAPAYDFREPAPPRAAWYDARGWKMDSTRWRECAAEALDALQLDGAL